MRVAKGSTEAGKTILKLVGKLPTERVALMEQVTDSSGEELAPTALFDDLVKLSNWLEILNAPLTWVTGKSVPFVSLGVHVIDYFYKRQATKKTLVEGTFAIAQCAYLQNVQEFAAQPLEELPGGIDASTEAVSETARKIQRLAAPISDEEALEVWFCFHESKLAKSFNRILQARLQESGLPEATAWTVTERVSRGTFRHLRETAHEVWDKVQRLQGLLGSTHLNELRLYVSLDRYLQQEIARKPAEKVFDEDFSFEDIYVPLQVKPIDRDADPSNIEHWVEKLLAGEDTKILFIQGGPGCGKSVFCRIFADKVRRELHPIWTPISIRLRDIATLGTTFEETLRLNLRGAFLRKNCLIESNTRFLFFLDGLDELLLSQNATVELKQLLGQIARFQEEYSGGEGRSNKHHRIILLGRPFALHKIGQELSDNLERVAIVRMAPNVQARWLANWDAAHGQSLAAGFQGFLESCPQPVQALAREPLLLYLLAAMYRDGRLASETFAKSGKGFAAATWGTPELAAKVSIYQQAIDWVVEKQRLDPHPNSLDWSVELEGEDLREVLQEAGLCAVQSGREYVRLKAVENRLKPRFVEALLEVYERPEENSLANAITTFHAIAPGEETVEFAHESFGEFLCAERLATAMAAWAQKSGQRRRTHTLPDEEVWWQVYDLLGYGHLSQEILNYVLELLQEKERERAGLLLALGERLQEFYWYWSGGDFIEEASQTLPQRKAALLKQQEIERGQRAVDIYGGFNALKVLFALHQQGIAFHPCSEPKTEMLERTRLLRLVGYGACLGESTFTEELCPYLHGADLREADLGGADLRRANLGRANLRRTNLGRANLSRANLSRANLSRANLRGANLSGVDFRQVSLIRANLSGANLSAANLSAANLVRTVFTGANLIRVDLSGANLSSANLSGVDLFKANLNKAKLSEAKLSEAKLREAKLREADLFKANLSGANLSRANLSRANLSGANLRESKLREANFREADLFKADLFRAALSRVNLIGAKLIGANLREIDFFKANLSGANLTSADLMGANLRGVDLRGANLRGANLRGAKYSGETRLPEGFNAAAARMIRTEP